MRWLLQSDIRRDIALGLVLLMLFVCLPFLGINRYFLGQLILFMFWATVAGQWNLLFGSAGVFSLAQLALFGIGAYATAMFNFYLGLSIWLSIPAGAMIAMVFSIFLGLSCLRLTGVYTALLTLAVSQVLYVLIVTDSECFMKTATACRQFTGGAAGFYGFDDFGMRTLLKKSWLIGNYFVVLTGMVISLGLTWAIMRSPLGIAFMALRDNVVYAQSLGVSRFRAQLTVFAFSAFFTGLMGGIYAGHFRTVSPSVMSLSQMLFLIAAVVLGGTGHFWGPFVGLGVLMILDEQLRDFAEFRMIGIGAILLVFSIYLPKGMLGLFRKPGTNSSQKYETQTTGGSYVQRLVGK